ncbi:MAG: sensor histidine kinase [Gallionella sp.]
MKPLIPRAVSRSASTIVLVLALALLLLVDVLVYRSVGNDYDRASWVVHTEKVIAFAEDIQSDLVDSETATRGYIITGNADFIKPHSLIRYDVQAKIKRLIELTSDNPDQLPNLKEIQTLAEKKLALSEELIRLQKVGRHQEAVNLIRSKEEKAVMDRIREAIFDIDAKERRLLVERVDKTNESFSFTRRAVVLADVLVMLLLVLSFVLLSRTRVALRDIDELMRMLIENIPNYAIFLLDPGGRILNWNAGAERLKGYRSEEIIGQHFSRLYPEEDIRNGKPAKELEEALAKERSDDEGWRVRKDGTRFWASMTIMPVRSASGELRGFAKITRDMSDYKNAKDEILQLNANLERQVEERTATNNELEAFSYSVSHDLRAPLRSIDGFSQALLEDYAGSLDDRAKGYLNRVRAATQRMGDLIDDMLTLSRVTRAEMRREIVDLSALAADVLAELQQNEPERKVVWHIESGMTAVGDPHLLRVMLFNLLGNAWKFTGKTASARIEFAAKHNDNSAMEYFVRDNGVGFDMTYAGKLFNAFQRLHRTDEFHGTGIGLATVKRVIHRHGGQVRGEGVSGKGATFYFTLPG